MKLYKKSTSDENIYLKNLQIYNSNISTFWYLGYFTFYFPIKSFYNGNNCAEIFTINKKIIKETEEQLSVFMRRFKKELNEAI